MSLLTQLLYIIVFITRYVDLFWTHPANSFIDGWNFCFKIWYIVSSFFIVFLMLKVFPRTREKEASWRLAAWSLLGCLVTTPLVNLIYHQLSVDATEVNILIASLMLVIDSNASSCYGSSASSLSRFAFCHSCCCFDRHRYQQCWTLTILSPWALIDSCIS